MSDQPSQNKALSNMCTGTARDGASGPFFPGVMRTQSIDVDHLTRYEWVAQFAPGRRVLDAGCGAGGGSRLLAAAGADEVVGVGFTHSVIEAAMVEMPDRVRLEVGDLRELGYGDGAFGLVIGFELLEYLEEPERVVDELTRVLAEDGLLVVSASGHETGDRRRCQLGRDQLAGVITSRLPHVRIWRQDPYLGSAIFPESGRDAGEFNGARVRPLSESSAPTCLIAIASGRELPETSSLLGLRDRGDFHEWQHALDAAEHKLQLKERLLDRLRDQLRDLGELQDRLLEAEQRLAQAPEVEYELGELTARIAETDQILQNVFASVSWRVTKPLRALKRGRRHRT